MKNSLHFYGFMVNKLIEMANIQCICVRARAYNKLKKRQRTSGTIVSILDFSYHNNPFNVNLAFKDKLVEVRR